MIDWDKPIEFRSCLNGNWVPARLLGTLDGRVGMDNEVVVAYPSSSDAREYIASVGKQSELVRNVPEPKNTGEVWLNIYPGTSASHNTKDGAIRGSGNGFTLLARKRVTWAEGEFDE